MNRGDALLRAKQAYATGAQRAGRALGKAGLIGDTPPDRDHRFRHWAYSLTRVHNSLAIAELDVPWWTYRAIDVVETWLGARARPIRAYEYGSGASTLWLAKRVDEVFSVEHHRGFGEQMTPVLAQLPNVHFRIVEPTTPGAGAIKVPSAKEGHAGLDFADYVASIDAIVGTFDLVVIDGRAREACLTAAIPRLANDGLIVFDNSRRARYKAAIAVSGMHERVLRGLTPTLPYPDQTSLLTRA
jgi:hypothetical protein